MKGKLSCPCGKCDVQLDNSIKWILESLEREMIIALYKHFELFVTSGARCEDYNKLVGGSKNSAHINGLAADIYCPDNHHKWFIKRYLYTKNIKRIGDGVNKGKFIHFDTAVGKLKYPHSGLIEYPQNTEWYY